MIKLVASDLDGTLLNSDREISDYNLKAIRDFLENGGHFAIATGRLYLDVKNLMDKYNLVCDCVMMNGAEVRDMQGNVVDEVNLDKEELLIMEKYFKENNILYEIYTSEGEYMVHTKEDSLKEMMNRMKIIYSHKNYTDEQLEAMAASDDRYKVRGYADSIQDILDKGIKIRKIALFNQSSEIIQKIREDLSVYKNLSLASSFRDNLEINNSLSQKGIAVKALADKLNINIDEVMILGDAQNDISMFEIFPNSVATANAEQEIKDMAKYITDFADNDGVGKAIIKYAI